MALKVGFVSLGCAKNQVDTEVMMGMLKDNGFLLTEQLENADILVVNTCGFITSAKEESINTILELAQYKNSGQCQVLIVAGCLAQKYKTELMSEMPEIDGIIGTSDIAGIVNIIKNTLAGEKTSSFAGNDYLYDHLTPRVQTTPAHTAYIKIAEGCNNRCSYCIIPELRGPLRSRPLESIVEEARVMISRGVRELILIAQDTTRYGEDIYHELKLAQLLKELNQIPGRFWIRILYAYPTYFNEELIEAIANLPKVCKYIDIPLQHINDEILKAMHRQGRKKDIVSLLNRLRQQIPEITLRTTFIVGFPGETDEQFQELLDFVQNFEFERVGVFTYSREEGTPAAEMPNQVPQKIKEERYNLLMEAQQEVSREKNRKKIGQTINVLIEGKSDESHELYIARTEGDAPEIDGIVYVQGKLLNSGDFARVKLTHAYEYDLMGEVINEFSK